MLMLMTILMSQAKLHSFVLPFVLSLCLRLRLNQAQYLLHSNVARRNETLESNMCSNSNDFMVDIHILCWALLLKDRHIFFS